MKNRPEVPSVSASTVPMGRLVDTAFTLKNVVLVNLHFWRKTGRMDIQD